MDRLRRTVGARCLIAMACAAALHGCVAALAVPAVGAWGLVALKKPVRVRAATPLPATKVTVTDDPSLAASAPGGIGALDKAGESYTLTDLTELPPPSDTSMAPDPWRPFVAFARDKAASLASDPATLSADGAQNLKARRQACKGPVPAVLIDLDPGKAVFSNGPGAQPATGLATQLAALRERGVVVMWITRAPAAKVGEIGEALQSAGLNPDGSDPLLLLRNSGDRKQALRQDASKDVCVLAIAGDDPSDFDELFDYLRNPAFAGELDTLKGAGWFEVPPPVKGPVSAATP
jgi:hypothetical protein